MLESSSFLFCYSRILANGSIYVLMGRVGLEPAVNKFFYDCFVFYFMFLIYSYKMPLEITIVENSFMTF